MPGMSAKIALRGGNQEAFRRWIANRNDVITANGLDQLMDTNQMPTLAAVGERFPDLWVSLQTYYVAIRDGLPDKPFEAPLPRLRQWIAEKLHEMSPIFATPQSAISKILDFAEVLNIPKAGRLVTPVLREDGSLKYKDSDNNCTLCKTWSQWHGGRHRDRGSHPGGDCAYL